MKPEQVSDVELLHVSRKSKGKAPARLGSPVNVSGDDQFSDTPKAKTKKVASATATAVKPEQVSDMEPLHVSRKLKGKAPARVVSPVNVSGDVSGDDQFSDTPKAKGRPSVTVPEALENQR